MKNLRFACLTFGFCAYIFAQIAAASTPTSSPLPKQTMHRLMEAVWVAAERLPDDKREQVAPLLWQAPRRG
ncbi:MAG: hypothetical protein AAGF20_02340, partial [Pseudomonadota bacterium]